MNAIVTENPVLAEPLRLALCITELHVGGAERCLVELATRLDRSRFSPRVVSLAPRPPQGEDALVERLEAAQIPVDFLDARSVRSAPAVAWRLARLWRRERPDVVQTFLFHANSLGCLAARWAGVRAIVTGVRVAERERAWHPRLAGILDRCVTRHVCVSQAVGDFMVADAGFRADKVVVIPNGVDIARFRDAMPATHASLGLPRGRRFLATIGRLVPQKGLDRLLGIAAKLLAALPNHDLVIVGDGAGRAQLEAWSREMGIADRVHWTGWRADIPEILAAADGLVLPSRWEGMPNVALEAMAAGKPVASLPAEGVRELLGAGAAEQVAASHDPQLLLDIIVAIFSSDLAPGRIGAANRAAAQERFSFAAMVEGYSRLYLALAQSTRRGR